MSYLAYPRLHFSGLFQADPSTVNNNPYHVKNSAFTPDQQSPGPGDLRGWWNPQGTAAWRFRDVSVTAALYRDGSLCDDPQRDPVIGMAINGANTRVAGKLVDLDPEQQMVSEIWGFQVLLGTPGNPSLDIPGDPNSFSSDFEVAPFTDIWVRYPPGSPDSFFSAFYQSVLRNVVFDKHISSRFLNELRDSSGDLPACLSIKFNVDAYNDQRGSAWFPHGRVSGTIGLWSGDEPARFTAGRMLRKSGSQAAPANYAYAFLDDSDRLHVDLGSSLPTTVPQYSQIWDWDAIRQANIGELYLGLMFEHDPPELLGRVDYLTPDWYTKFAGVQTFELTRAQARSAARAPLVLAVVNDEKQITATLLGENPWGAFARTDQFVFLIDSGTKAQARLWALRFGQPAANQTFELSFYNAPVQGQHDQGPVPGPAPGTPEVTRRSPRARSW